MLAAAENALIAGLRAHPLAVAKKLGAVDSLPKLPTDQLLARYASAAPALYVLPGVLSVRNGNAYLMFPVAGVVRNVAGHAQARKGDGIDLGCDHLLTAMIQALHDKTLGGTTWALTSAEMVDDPLFDKAGVAAVDAAFESGPLELPGGVDFADLDDFKTFHADMDIPPHVTAAEHQKWLAEPEPDHSTSQPDASLTVQLPGATP